MLHRHDVTCTGVRRRHTHQSVFPCVILAALVASTQSAMHHGPKTWLLKGGSHALYSSHDRSSKETLQTRAHDVSPSHLVKCINEVHDATPLEWAGAIGSDLGSLKVMGAWWSKNDSSIPVTVVTQASVDRLSQLEAQCRSWNGRLSTVIYTSLIQDSHKGDLSDLNQDHLARAVHEVAQFVEMIDHTPDMCLMDVLLVYEVFADKRSAMLYPLNMLRNLARLQARTPVIALFDGDFVVSSSLHHVLSDANTAAEIVRKCEERSIFVVPAFEVNALRFRGVAMRELAETSVKLDKKAFVRLVRVGSVQKFDEGRDLPEQLATDYEKWYTATKVYPVIPNKGYAPWVLMNRLQPPWHDARFRGYGSEGPSFISTLRHANFKFLVHPEVWMIHKQKPINHASDLFYKWHVEAVESGVNAKMEHNDYTPVLGSSVEHCLKTLSWWSRPHESVPLHEIHIST